MVLVESSAWILVIRGQLDLQLRVPDQDIATCPPVVQEILQGSDGPKDYANLREMLLHTEVLDAPMPFRRFEEAAQLYLRCRDAAFTIRKTTDCLIAACAIAHGATLLHDDRDFDHIALVAPLKAIRV